MAKRSAVAALLNDLAIGLAKLPHEEQQRVLTAGRKFVASRRALLSKRPKPASARRPSPGRILAAN
jgi:hypothetical protein